MSYFFNNILKKIQRKDPEPNEKEPDPEICSDFSPVFLIPFPSLDLCQQIHKKFESSYKSHYKIWNVSEYSHETGTFSGKCIEFLNVGYPNPSLSIFFSIFESINRWLEKDAENIALIHCQSTKARSTMVLAGYLVWRRQEQNIMNAFRKIVKSCKSNIELLPSQLRYLKYIQEIVEKPIPRLRKVRITKIIVDGVPGIEKNGSVKPYLQIFQNTEMIFCSHHKDNQPEVVEQKDMSFVFDIDVQVEGDVLIRCRHLGKYESTTIFRVMFHTAFIEGQVFRFTKSEIDGAFVDPRFPETFTLDFFLDENEEAENDDFSESIFKYRRPEEEEEVKIDKESDEEFESYFKELDNK